MGDTNRIVCVSENNNPVTTSSDTATHTNNNGTNVSAGTQQQQTSNNHSNSSSNPAAAIFSISPRERAGDTSQQQDTCALYTTNSGGGSWLCCIPCSWLRKNNSIHKAGLTIATLLVTSLLVASPVLFLISSVPEGGIIRNCFPQVQEKCDNDGIVYSVCDSATCKTLSSQILSSMDMSVSPCYDFYQYSCGRTSSGASNNKFTVTSMQSNVNSQLKDLFISNTSNWVFEKLGQFFNSCITTQEKPTPFQSVYEILDELGGYLPPSSLGPTDLTPLLIKLFEINGSPLIRVYIDDDEIDRTHSAIYIDLPQQLGLFSIMSPLRYFLQKKPENSIMEVKNLLHGFLPKRMNEQQRTAEYQNILSFIAALDKLQQRTRNTHWNISTQRFNFTRLQTDYTFIQWEPLLEAVLSINISDYDVLYVVSPMYLAKLEDLIARFHKRVIHNAILMIYARDVLQILANTSGYHLHEFCVQLTANLFNEATSALYVRQFPPYYIQHLTKKVSMLLNRLKNTLAARMKHINWIDDATKTMALNKLKALREQYLIWPSLFNLTYVAGNLKKVYVDPNNFFTNVIYRFRQINTDKWNNYRNFESRMHTYMVHVHYKPQRNIILIPVSLLTQAYLRDDIPEYISYASIGTILMHAILHGFDLNGINFDANGTRINWLSPESRLGLEARIDCFARQYAKHFLKSKILTSSDLYQFDWNQTQNENIADVGGFQTSYETWRNVQHGRDDMKEDQALFGAPLTPRQLFFVVAAQMYCIYQTSDDYMIEENLRTSSERVNSIVMNSPSFPEAFNCPLGSKMNPAKKCSTW